MPPSKPIQQLAAGFQWSAWIIGIPALIVVAFTAFALIRMALSPSPPSVTNEPSGLASLITLLVGFARGLGAVFGFLAGLAKILITIVFVASLGALLLAVLVWITGRGLAAGASWSRIAAILISVSTLLISTLGLLTFRLTPLGMISFTLAAASTYALHTLFFRFFP